MNQESPSKDTLARTPTLRRISSLISPSSPTYDPAIQLSDMEKRIGGFVARKHLRKRGNYDSALDNYNQRELRQMDEALIGISNEMQKYQTAVFVE
jgi:hypothetical protein